MIDDADPYDVRLALRASGLLREFNVAGVLSAADVHVAERLGRLGGESDETVLLAAALAVRAVRLGSVCVELSEVRDHAAADGEEAVDTEALPWPDPDPWQQALSASPLVAVGDEGAADRPLRLVDGLLYLDRYWRQEEVVRTELDSRLRPAADSVDAARLDEALGRLFTQPETDRQRTAALRAARHSLLVLAGGPGTGKTTTVAKLVDLLRSLRTNGERPPRVALAAPTGKAAARLQEAVTAAARNPEAPLDVGDVHASTLHRLLGRRMGSNSRFRHDRHNRLPYDVVVVDECSMVSLTLMSRLLEAVRPEAKLVLVGDPDQLASVEAGAVLGDLVARRSGQDDAVVRLVHRFRYGPQIGALADAVRDGEADLAVDLLRAGGETVTFVEDAEVEAMVPGGVDAVRAEVVHAAGAVFAAASRGDATAALDALGSHRLLCGHRRGPYGVARWTREVERWLAAAGPEVGDPGEGEWYVGRPLLVTTNDPEVELYNGDTGVVVSGDAPDRPMAAFARGDGPVRLGPSRLPPVQTVHAMTVHKAQGSQFRSVTVLLPPPESPLLTRELLYTAITRAEGHVRVVGSADAVARAVNRRVMRASGLRRR